MTNSTFTPGPSPEAEAITALADADRHTLIDPTFGLTGRPAYRIDTDYWQGPAVEYRPGSSYRAKEAAAKPVWHLPGVIAAPGVPAAPVSSLAHVANRAVFA